MSVDKPDKPAAAGSAGGHTIWRGLAFSAALHAGLPLCIVIGALVMLPDMLHKPPIEVTVVNETVPDRSKPEPAGVEGGTGRPAARAPSPQAPRAPGDTGFAATLETAAETGAPQPLPALLDRKEADPPSSPPETRSSSASAAAVAPTSEPERAQERSAEEPAVPVVHRQAVQALRELAPRLTREDRSWERPGRESEGATLAAARYVAAAAQQSMAGTYNLALAQLSGRGTPVDPAAAARSLEQAAARGYTPAMLRLAELRLTGPSETRDVVEATARLRVAAALGDTAAGPASAVLLASLQVEQQAAVRRRTAELQAGLSPDRPVRPEKLNTDFLAAVRDDNAEAVADLIAAGADANAADPHGRTGLIDAAWRGHTGIVELLVRQGADIDAIDDEGRSPLMWTAINGHVRTAGKLLAHKPEVDRKDRQGLTPLMRSAWNGHRDVVRLLLNAGADPALRAPDGKTAADRAGERKDRAILEMLQRAGAG